MEINDSEGMALFFEENIIVFYLFLNVPMHIITWRWRSQDGLAFKSQFPSSTRWISGTVTYFAVVHLFPAEPSCWPRKFFIFFSLDMVIYSRLALNSMCSRGQPGIFLLLLLFSCLHLGGSGIIGMCCHTPSIINAGN